MSTVKEFLKKNPFIFNHYTDFKKERNKKHFNTELEEIFDYQKRRFIQYSGAFNDGYIKDSAYITWLYHVVEKGLTMPDMRLGFGQDKVRELIKCLNEYYKKFPDSVSSNSAIATVNEYYRVHKELGYDLPSDIIKGITKLQIEHPNIAAWNQKSITPEEYFSYQNNFLSFSNSRHCIRNFDSSKPIDINSIIKAIDIARNAPSACNRQPSRVHIVTNKEKIQSILEMQNGSRGFRQLTDKLLIITGDLQTVLGPSEFFDLNTNVGIFIMNLAYALHYKKIGCCILNWYVMPDQDRDARKIACIPDQETIVALMACGYPPEEFKVAISERLNTEDIYSIVE